MEDVPRSAQTHKHHSIAVVTLAIFSTQMDYLAEVYIARLPNAAFLNSMFLLNLNCLFYIIIILFGVQWMHKI